MFAVFARVRCLRQLSPDGRWLAYHSNDLAGGTFGISVQSFPAPGRGKWQVSTGAGVHARWRRDGRELFYHTGGRFMAVPIAGDSMLEFGVPVQSFQARQIIAPLAVGYRQEYDVTADGRRFLLNLPVDDPTPQAIAVVANWPALLKK